MLTSTKSFLRIACIFVVTTILFSLLPLQSHAATTALSGANESWMFPMGISNSTSNPSSHPKWNVYSHLGKREVSGASVNHQGIDIPCAYEAPVYAAKSGVVCYAGPDNIGSRGTFIRINHLDGTYSQYQHLSKIYSGITNGVEVAQGKQIGYAGNTGGIGETHLHFQINTNGDVSLWDSVPLNSMPSNECAFVGLDYGKNLCPNIIPGSWLNSWKNTKIYQDMGITDSNTYSSSSYYPSSRPAYSAGVVEKNWPPIYLQTRIRYYMKPCQKIVLTDPTTYPSFEATTAGNATYKVSVDFIQECINHLGISVDYDGYHGPKSTQAVRNFQAKYGIAQSGNIDKQTWDKVIALMTEKYPVKKPLDITDPSTFPTFTSTVLAHTSGTTVSYNSNVKFIQLCLQTLGYTIDVDGYHGPKSTEVVKTFQAENNLTVNGSINKETWDRIVKLVTEKYQSYQFSLSEDKTYVYLQNKAEDPLNFLIIYAAYNEDGQQLDARVAESCLFSNETFILTVAELFPDIPSKTAVFLLDPETCSPLKRPIYIENAS